LAERAQDILCQQRGSLKEVDVTGVPADEQLSGGFHAGETEKDAARPAAGISADATMATTGR